MEGETLKNCIFVKTILMILVVFGHSIAFWSGHWFTENPLIPSITLKVLYNWLNSFHIYAFTLVSGYIFAYKIRAGGGYRKYSTFLESKIKRLLIPYVFSASVWVAPLSVHFFKWNWTELFRKYILCINPSQLWFLWMLFWIFAIMWPIWKIVDRNPIVGYIVSGVFYSIGIVGNKVFPNVFCIWTSCQYIVFFYIGMRINKTQENKRQLMKIAPWYIWGIFDVAIFAMSIFINIAGDSTVAKITNAGLNLSLHIIGAVAAFAILQTLASCIDWENSMVLNALSHHSMPIYLFHQQIIYFMIEYLNGRVNPWINAGMNFAVALMGSFLISVVLMKWSVSKSLIGGKVMK